MSLNLGRRGLSQVDLLVGLILLAIIGSAAARSALAAERTARAANAKTAAQAALDGGVWFLSRELEELGRDTGVTDLLSQSPESLTYRALRGVGLACQVSVGAVDLQLGSLAAPRQPQAGRDSLLLLALDDSSGRALWIPAPVLAVGGTACGGQPALRLSTLLDTSRFSLSRLPRLVPVRLYEIMQARLYPSSGKTWLGVRSVSAGEIIQPLAGPFGPGSSGFTPLDSVGGASTVVGSTRSLRLQLTAPWTGWPGSSAAPIDSAELTLAPRNLLP